VPVLVNAAAKIRAVFCNVRAVNLARRQLRSGVHQTQQRYHAIATDIKVHRQEVSEALFILIITIDIQALVDAGTPNKEAERTISTRCLDSDWRDARLEFFRVFNDISKLEALLDAERLQCRVLATAIRLAQYVA